MENKEVLLQVKDLQITFKNGRRNFVAVDDVNFEIYKGETFSLVGESGSGKTTIGRAIIRINPTTKGDIIFKGKKINGKMSKQLDTEVIQKIQMIFQDPMASLNERAKIDYIVSEGLYNFHLYKDEQDRKNKVEDALKEVGLLPEFASRFPHEFSGGQRQRIGIARALIMEPEFVIADEPISALDVSIRAQVLNLLNKLKKEKNLTYLFIAHDLSVVRFISDRIAVIHKGRIVELAESEKEKQTVEILKLTNELNEIKNKSVLSEEDAEILKTENLKLKTECEKLKAMEQQVGAAMLDARLRSDELVKEADEKAELVRKDVYDAIGDTALKIDELSGGIAEIASSFTKAVGEMEMRINVLTGNMSKTAQALIANTLEMPVRIQNSVTTEQSGIYDDVVNDIEMSLIEAEQELENMKESFSNNDQEHKAKIKIKAKPVSDE